MGFKSVNEIEKFSFDDCVIGNFAVMDDEICMELSALIVRRNNSQNTNFTESYADVTVVRLLGGKVLKTVKDGYKYYNADEVLISEIPDRELDEEETKELFDKLQGAYLYFMEKDKEENGSFHYTIGVEFVDETENTMSDSYGISVSFQEAVFTWERYLNRVQH